MAKAEEVSPKILTVDIETFPNIVHTWGLWKQNISIDHIIKPSTMACWAAKWMHEKNTHFMSVHHNTQHKMLQGIWDLMDEADWIIHFNGQAFDMPKIRWELFKNHFAPPSPFVGIDLMLHAKKIFKAESFKLEFLLRECGLEGKMKHEGFSMWPKCMDGDEKAWKEMKAYNIHDVIKTEMFYEKLAPWIPRHPNRGLYTGELCCPRCGSKALHADEKKLSATNGNVYQTYRCANKKCRGWVRDNKPLNKPTDKFRFYSV